MDNKIVLLILCIFLPPVAVYLKSNKLDKMVIIDVILCLFGWLPGVVFALWVSFLA